MESELSLQQGTAEWKQARCGIATASRMADVLSKIKTGESASRRDYKFQLVAERLSGKPQDDGFVSKDMEFGIENEEFARSTYEVSRDVMVDQCGLILHPRIKQAGASPDGTIGSDGLIEIKAPKMATHLGYLMAGVVPSKYQPQMNWQLACTGRAYCDFVSFRPDLPEHLQLFVVRFGRDDAEIRRIEAEVVIFLQEVAELVERLRKVAA